MEIKHNVVAQIYSFGQKENESIRDCANRFCQYISQCPVREMPGPDRLISLFLEGLSNKSLHENLYGQKYETLNECIKDATDLDDNCKLFGNVDKKVNSSDTSSTQSSQKKEEAIPRETAAIADLVIRKMNQMFKPAIRAPEKQRFPKPYQCGICEGDHPTSQCSLKPQNPAMQMPRQDKWCDFEHKWTNHETKDCWHQIKYLREQGVVPQPNQGIFRGFANQNANIGEE